MGSRVRLITASDSWWRSPAHSSYYRRQSVDRALDGINARAATPSATPPLMSRVCRPAPLVIIALLLAAAGTTVYFTHNAIAANARELNSFITEVVLDSSHLVADRIRDVVFDSTDTIHEPFDPSGEETNSTTTMDVTNDNTTLA